jgi:hypothetical protein
MKVRFAFTGLAMVLAAVLVLPAAGAARTAVPSGTSGNEQVFAYYSFEKDLAPWKPMTDSPFHAYKMVQQTGANGCSNADGSHYARIISVPKSTMPQGLNPPTKYGTWTAANLLVGGVGVRQVTVEWSARWSPDLAPKPTFDHAAVYVGLKAPAKGLDFALPPKSNLTYNWQTFKYTTYVKLADSIKGTPVYVGVGWDNTGRSMDLDCLRIAITVPPTSTSTK